VTIHVVKLHHGQIVTYTGDFTGGKITSWPIVTYTGD